ncbi:MAG TPA: hypothetical protein VLW85_01350, partial [Myxococcales bacterium]|nr:hypothetical protein [Myxococcales bacterium]
YLVSAPWNALTAADVRDVRTARGAGTALVADAVRRSKAHGFGGRVSLEAISDQCREVYEHLGFTRAAEHVPIPAGLYSAAEARTRCWMVLEPAAFRRAA